MFTETLRDGVVRKEGSKKEEQLLMNTGPEPTAARVVGTCHNKEIECTTAVGRLVRQ